MGKPISMKSICHVDVGLYVRELCEVKHLSSTWKINQSQRKLGRDSLSSGERTGKDIEKYQVESSKYQVIR